MYKRYGDMNQTLINRIGNGVGCIGGDKGTQLQCREQLATQNEREFGDREPGNAMESEKPH